MKEIENWKVHKTFQEITNTFRARYLPDWQLIRKTKGNIYKAKLVARGFE